jgi:ketosteroid isomerase-like protein
LKSARTAAAAALGGEKQMKTLVPLTLATAAAFAVTGCTKGAQAAVDTSKIADAIKAQEATWQKGYADKDVNVLAGEYTDDAAMANPGEPLATTDIDRRKSLQALLSDPNLKLTFASDRVTVASAGDMASSRGHYTITTTDKATNKPVTSSGTYLTVYKKQADGGFKAVEDVVIPGPAMAAAK